MRQARLQHSFGHTIALMVVLMIMMFGSVPSMSLMGTASAVESGGNFSGNSLAATGCDTAGCNAQALIPVAQGRKIGEPITASDQGLVVVEIRLEKNLSPISSTATSSTTIRVG